MVRSAKNPGPLSTETHSQPTQPVDNSYALAAGRICDDFQPQSRPISDSDLRMTRTALFERREVMYATAQANIGAANVWSCFGSRISEQRERCQLYRQAERTAVPGTTLVLSDRSRYSTPMLVSCTPERRRSEKRDQTAIQYAQAVGGATTCTATDSSGATGREYCKRGRGRCSRTGGGSTRRCG